eukprot:TRINITY_DN234_c0_g1_i3.p1 TRINITY_DN234_c0_g1~~TRINITY_DN234_c0_g1_i3.p1  ORF type:complete len:169 (-),score=9.47 TRINITY_DN234_c0_g1_i3:272-778(-)
MCSSPPGSNESNAPPCYKCNGKGHIKSRCPNNVAARCCYKCGMFGHHGRECMLLRGGMIGVRGGFGFNPTDFYGMYGMGPNPGNPMGMMYPPHMGGPQGVPSDVCYGCGMPGHIAKNCPQNPQANRNACYKCGLEGHIAKDCNICFICRKTGHFFRDCPEREKEQSRQ